MCGIIAIVGTEPAAQRLVDSLRRLEYRGYDSAGVATLVDGRIERRRAEGKIRNLEAELVAAPLAGTTGMGHTRWATHGAPITRNAHPHVAGRVAVVHNGIIENFAELKAELVAAGRSFTSDTDTEVVAHLIDAGLERGLEPVAAFNATVDRLQGAYALAALVEGADDLVLGARHGPPMVLGEGDGEMVLGSDALAVAPFTTRIVYLEDGDRVEMRRTGYRVFDASARLVERTAQIVSVSAALVEKGNHRHFMEKEIYEQPEAVQHTLTAYVDPIARTAFAPGDFDFSGVARIQIVACGTAFYAGMIAKYLFERLAGLPVDVEVASEFRYRQPALTEGSLALAVSQSGETADTLAALRWCASAGLTTAALVNVASSTMAREADHFWPTRAGPEIGVASTKAFTAQVAALTALAVAAARQRGRLTAEAASDAVARLLEAPRLIGEALKQDETVHALAQDFVRSRDVLYLGRGAMHPLAMEGALKLKELSYIHAEGYAAGELKHGPIALIDEDMPVVVLAPHDDVFEKTVSNLQEVAARGGRVYVVTDAEDERLSQAVGVLYAPPCDPLIAPMVFAVPIQLLAYHWPC